MANPLQPQSVSPAEWAAIALADPATVILDTETTGIPKRRRPEFIVEIAAIQKGSTLIDLVLNPQAPLADPDWSRRHGITPGMLAGRPTFADIVQDLEALLRDKHVLAWNAPFDRDILRHELVREKLRSKRTFPALAGLAWFDPCETYRQWLKERGLYEFGSAKLNGPHRARGDCLAVVQKLYEMARG
jgi:DNA polymerase III subunit epsilon